jgi:hypothetical protein
MNTCLFFIIILTALVTHVVANPTSLINGISGESLVQVQGKGSVLMKHVELGDHVLVRGNKHANQVYEPIQQFAELDSEAPTEYLQILTTSARLEVTKDHRLFLVEGHSVSASTIQINDQLATAGVKNSISVVKAIKTVVRDGRYAPVTLSGTIVVNGIRISTSAPRRSSSSDRTATSTPRARWSASISEIPQRIWCYFFVTCEGEQENLIDDTSSSLPSSKLLWWFNEQGAGVKFLLYAPLLAILSVLTVLEMVAVYPLSVVLLLLLLGTIPFSVRVKLVSQ